MFEREKLTWVCGHDHEPELEEEILPNGKSVWKMTTELYKPTQVCPSFIRGMADRMAVAFHRYGDLKDAPKPPHAIDEIAGLNKRVELYQETGNGEYLMDAANFAMIECMLGFHPNFNMTPVEQGPGLQLSTGEMTRETHQQRRLKGASGGLAARIREGREGD